MMPKFDITQYFTPLPAITHTPRARVFLLSSRPLKSKFCNSFPLSMVLKKSLACTLLVSEVMGVDGRYVETNVFIAAF